MRKIDISNYEFSQIPFDRIVRVGQRSLIYNDLFCVSWLLGRYCNFRCTYCWPYARSDKKDHRPFPVIQNALTEIKKQARERGFNSFHFSFSGGEPTLHPNYLEIVKLVNDDTENCNYQSLHMTTNLSQPLAWFKQYAQFSSFLNRVSVTASYHKPFTKKELFRDKIHLLQDSNIQVTVNMVLSPDRFEDLWEDALFFNSSDINVTLKPQSDEKAAKIVPGYTDTQLRLLKEGMPQRDFTEARIQKSNLSIRRPKSRTYNMDLHWKASVDEGVPQIMQVELIDHDGKKWYMDQAERFNSFEFNKFNGWECSSGYRSIIIREPDGLVKRSYSCNDAPLGHIETGFKLFDSPMICSTRSCLSSADSKIPKRKPGVDLPLWKSWV